MGSWVTGVSLITAVSAEGRPMGCTLNALTSLSLDPPSLLISLGIDSRTLAALQASGRFCVNVLASDQEAVSRRFSDASLTTDQRFAAVAYDLKHGVPVLTGCVATLICDVADTIPIHDHVLVVGTVALGAVDQERHPLVFFGGSYELPKSIPTP
jgi:flavin reductase (DIM6/NTAB) family NADH-FMN oxidoreductase RutF